jgi:hypothetical protein
MKQQTTTPFSKEVVVFLWILFLRKDKLCKILHGTALSLIIAFYFLEEAFGDLPQPQILCNTGRAALLVVGWMMGTLPIGAGAKIAEMGHGLASLLLLFFHHFSTIGKRKIGANSSAKKEVRRCG